MFKILLFWGYCSSHSRDDPAVFQKLTLKPESCLQCSRYPNHLQRINSSQQNPQDHSRMFWSFPECSVLNKKGICLKEHCKKGDDHEKHRYMYLIKLMIFKYLIPLNFNCFILSLYYFISCLESIQQWDGQHINLLIRIYS